MVRWRAATSRRHTSIASGSMSISRTLPCPRTGCKVACSVDCTPLPLRPGTVLELPDGHSNWVSACGWSPDGRRIVSGSSDNSLKVWDAQSGDCVLTLQGHSNSVSACGWSPDGRRIVSGSSDNSLKSVGCPKRRLRPHSPGTFQQCDGVRMEPGRPADRLRIGRQLAEECGMPKAATASSLSRDIPTV
jgi:WD40 repeat protein